MHYNPQFPISRGYFEKHINPIIKQGFSSAGRPASISNYRVFSATLYVLQNGIAWRDLPECYGYWHTVYLRFKRGNDRGVWWKALMKLK